MRSLIKNKKGAVNSYRFISIFILTGIIFSMIGFMNADINNADQGYNLKESQRVQEIADAQEDIAIQSDSIVQANQYSLTTGYGDQRGLGKNVWAILRNGFIPSGFIPEGQQATGVEQIINMIIIWLRWIITIFASYELFQILVKPKTT